MKGKWLFRYILVFMFSLNFLIGANVSIEQKIVGLYVAYFDRAPDQEGFNYWLDRAKNSSNSSTILNELSLGFAGHPIFISTYSGLDNRAFVEKIYQNISGKDGDAEGIAYWKSELDRGVSRSDMVASFVSSLLSDNFDDERFSYLSVEEKAKAQARQDFLTNKVTVSLKFVNVLGELSNVKISPIENDPAYIASKNILRDITEDKSTVDNTIKFLDEIQINIFGSIIFQEEYDPIKEINDKYRLLNFSITAGSLKNPVIEGVQYYCSTGEDGITNEYGMFECIGAPVTFKIGGLTLGTLNKFTDGKVYLQDILGLDRDNFSDEKLKLLAWFIQSLDDDGDITQRVTITQDVRDRLTKVQDFRDMSESDVKLTLELLGKYYVPECISLKNIGANVECGSDGDYIDNPSSDSNSSSNDLSTNKETISGYVIDEPIANATIELQEINGTLIRRFKSVTNVDGSYNIKVDEKYKNKDFILKAYNGTISNKTFDGDLYGYHLSGDGLNINLTPLNTMLIILSSQFSDIDFSARIAKAKGLLSATYGISEDEFSSIKDSDFSNFDIVKFRELANSIGFNSLIQSLVADSIDGYADGSDSKLLFASAKQRVLKDAKTTFAIVDTDLNSDEVSKLTVKGVSEKEDATTGTMDMLTDVIATKTDTFKDTDGNDVTKETIVFRSFNIGKWKGKLNEETTLLARIFLDYRLTNLTPSVQESIATKLLKERVDDFQKALKYQDMATDMPFAYPYYIELMEGLRVFALSYISNFSIAQTDKVDATLSKLSKFMRYQKDYTTDDDNLVGMGLLQVRATKDALEFANYAKVNYGFRAYEIDGVKQDYDYPMNDFKANIIKSTVQGGTVGGIWDYVMNNTFKFNADGNVIKYEKKLLGENNSFNSVSKVKLEMYKWQWGYPTLLNIADGIELAIKTGTSGKSLADRVREKFAWYDTLKKRLDEFDTFVTILNTVIDGYEGIVELADGKDSEFLSKDLIKYRKEVNEVYDLGKKAITFANNLLEEKGYPKHENIRNWDEIKEKALVSLAVPEDTGNGFHSKMVNLIAENKQKNYILLFGGITSKLLKKSSIPKSRIKQFNEEYGEAFTFEQMHYIMAYKLLSEDKNYLDKFFKNFKLDSKIKTKKAMRAVLAEYSIILVDSFGKGLGKISISDILKSNIKNLSNLKDNINTFSKVIKNAKNLVTKGNMKKAFTAVANFMVDSLDGMAKNLAGDVAKSAVKAILGGGVTTAIKVNDISSYVAGNFLTPNKQYLELNKDGDKISIKRPPLTLVGLDSSHISDIESYDISIEFHDIVKKYTNNFLNKKAINNSYLVTLDKDYSVSYVPHYDVIVSQTRASKFKDMLNNATFLNNTFMKFDFDIEKSNNNKIDGSFEKNETLSRKNIVITVDNMKKVKVEKGENDLYSFNTMEAWGHKLGDFNTYVYIVLPNTQRGIFRESINLQFFQPKATKEEFIMPNDLYEKQQSRKNYIYLATTGKTLGKNLIIEKVVRDGYDWLRIENKNSFDIYFEVARDYIDNGLFQSDDRGTLSIDYKVDKNSVYLLSMLDLKDDKGNYNDVEFNFYDGIAEDFFENNGFAEPRLSNYLEANDKDSSLVKASEILVYTVKLDDITKTDNYLMITNYGNGTQTESTLSDNGEVKVEFNMPLSSDSLNKIKVYDVNEKRYLNSDEYTVAHTSGNEYLITIKNYKNHHEYKLVFPSDLTSESGAKFLDEKEISNFIYYNQAPIAIAGEDTTITVDEIQDFKLDGSNSYDKDGTIVKMEWFYKDKLVWDGNIFPLKNLDVNNSKYVLKLVVTDNEGAIAYDEVVINILNLNIPPTANAGADQTITVDEIQDFKLDGSNSYDKDGTIVKMEWFYKDKLVWDGNIFPLKNLNVSDSKYVLKLVVTDNGGLTDSDEVVITIISNQIKHNNISTLKKTGQTISYAKYDDGFYEKGIILNYTKESADILDRTTGLIWQNGNDTNGSKKSWSDAKNYCEGLTGGWRLPTRQELSGLVRYDNYNPSIDNIFNYTTADYYWSGDDSKRVFNDVWVVSFSEGVENTTSKNNSYFVRCVKNRASLVANAGADQIVREKESVTLDGTHSPNRENIVSYKWSEGEKVLGEGEKFSISTLSDGVHKIMLTVKDKNGQLDSDEVIITVTSEKDVLKKTSQNISYAKFDDGFYEKGVAINYAKSGDNILDKSTGLTWQDIDSGQKLWEEAKSYCASLDGNWRLPTRRELSNLVAYNRYNPSIDDIFSSTTSDYYWTIDTSKRDHDKAWAISFSEGVESALAKRGDYYVRCVQSNLEPIANAGVDQLVAEGQPVVLRATESSRPELIKSYIWLEGDKELGQGAVIELNNMIDGEHEITLIIKDENGNELSRDNLRVNIISDNRVLKQTGQNISYAKFDDGYYEKGVVLNYAKRDDNILDRTTGLLWRDEEETKTETYSWQDAKDYCGSLDGHWRLPTRKELSNLVQYNRYNPSINDIFSFTASDYHWTMDTSIRDRDKAWAISFNEGVEDTIEKGNSYYARCVQSDFVPTANAGADILTIKETPIVLDAGNSPRKNLITKFLWENSETELGEGERLAIDTSFSGREKITLTITDKEGREDTDDLWLTVIKNDKIVKKTGQTESYTDYDDGDYQKGVSLSYSNHGDSVTDNATGLEWRDDENTDTLKMTWKEANDYCSRDNSNWRLPTRRELSNLVDYGKYNPSIDESFNNTASDYYWTIDTSMRDNDKAWAISFSEGVEYSSDKSNSYYVRCVNAN